MPKAAARAAQQRLGVRIHVLRRERGLTQEVFAQRCGLSQKYLSELERGEKTPSWQTLVSLAHLGCEIRLASLVYGIDEEVDVKLVHLDELLAGRSAAVRDDVLAAVKLLLHASDRTK